MCSVREAEEEEEEEAAATTTIGIILSILPARLATTACLTDSMHSGSVGRMADHQFEAGEEKNGATIIHVCLCAACVPPQPGPTGRAALL